MDEKGNWEFCQIKLQVVHDGRGHAAYSGAPPNYWFQFVARVETEKGSYSVEKSEKIPFPSIVLFAPEPKPVQNQHQNFLDLLIRKLEEDGWQPLGQQGDSWWEHYFKRQKQPQESWLSKVKSLLSVN